MYCGAGSEAAAGRHDPPKFGAMNPAAQQHLGLIEGYFFLGTKFYHIYINVSRRAAYFLDF